MLLQQHFGARGLKSHLIICSNLQHALNLNYLHYFGRTHASGDLIAASDNLQPLGPNNYYALLAPVYPFCDKSGAREFACAAPVRKEAGA
jgi:hypothetical protein